MLIAEWLKFGSVVLAVGVAAEVPTAAADGPAAVEVKPSRLTVTTSGRGVVEAAGSTDVTSAVPGETTLLSILPQGTQVKKGQLVAELDSAPLKAQLLDASMDASRAEVAFQTAKLGREIAEIAVTEFVEGTAPHELETLTAEAADAREAIKKSEARLDRTRRDRKRMDQALAARVGSPTPGDILADLSIEDRTEAAEEALSRHKAGLERATLKRAIFEKYTRDKTTKELKSKVELKRADELWKQADWELARSRVEKLNRQISRSKLYAPSDGLVVYADPNQTAGRRSTEKGATVRERQRIFRVADTSRLVVRAEIPEGRVDRVASGQPVEIRVDAVPDEILSGKVESVAVLPDPSPFLKNARKVYATRVTLDKTPERLRPGMVARAEIQIRRLDDVLSVPVGSVVHYAGRDHVAVVTPGGKVDWREVGLGETDDKVVEVKTGLKPGERVAVSPIELMSEDEKREKLGKPTTAPAP